MTTECSAPNQTCVSFSPRLRSIKEEGRKDAKRLTMGRTVETSSETFIASAIMNSLNNHRVMGLCKIGHQQPSKDRGRTQRTPSLTA